SPFEKGGLRGIFEAPFSGRLALFKQLKCYKYRMLETSISNAFDFSFWSLLSFSHLDLFRVSCFGFRILHLWGRGCSIGIGKGIISGLINGDGHVNSKQYGGLL
ncbi:MAG: hypothetical protein AB1487_12095, partial [Thermodesulfobacteriota bacterium]